MASKRVTLSTAAQALFTAPKHAVGRLTGINIDNQSAAAATIRIQDVFTPDASNGTASPTEQTKYRLQITVPATTSVNVDRNSLEDIVILGACSAIGDAISTSCVIIANYHTE